MDRWGGTGSPWRRQDDWLFAADEVHARWRELAGVRALNRLRSLRARRRGVIRPLDAVVRDGHLAVRLDPKDLDGGIGGTQPSFEHWVERELAPLVQVLCEGHGQGVSGFGASPVLRGR